MLRGLLREVGLAAASLLASIFVMTFLLFALAKVDLADADYAYVSMALAYYILPCCVGLGALVSGVQSRWSPRRPLRATLNLILGAGLVFILLISYWIQAPLANLFFLLPGFVLWGFVSGLFARKRSATGVGR